MIMFLGTPVMPELTSLINTGIYIMENGNTSFNMIPIDLIWCWTLPFWLLILILSLNLFHFSLSVSFNLFFHIFSLRHTPLLYLYFTLCCFAFLFLALLGLYINDLSMHDFSRDLMLAGTQQSVELKLALDQEQQKSKKLEESMRKLDEEMRRTDELLYQMIPKQVADRLRRGENPIDTCEVKYIPRSKRNESIIPICLCFSCGFQFT